MAGAPRASAPVEALFGAERIASRIDTLAGEIARSVANEILVVSVLKGRFMVAADLVRAPQRAGLGSGIDFMILPSHGVARTSSGEVALLPEIAADASGRTVLLVDDLMDTGRELPPRPDHEGFDRPPHCVVGYRMGLGQHFRALPYIGRIMQD